MPSHRFKLSEIQRAIRAAIAAGLEVSRVEVLDDGRIHLVTSNKSEAPRRKAKPAAPTR
jgi:hypothetical protein